MEKGKLLRMGSLILLTGILSLSVGCASTKVERKAVDTTIDISGRWNDADSRMVAEEMIGDCLDRPWLERFRDTHGGKRPTVIVGRIRNRSHEHINDETMKGPGQEIGADFMLIGTLNTIRDEAGRKAVMFYQTNLELVDMATNIKAWIGEKKIKKLIKKRRFKW